METNYAYNAQEDLLKDDLIPMAEYAGFWLRFAAYIIDVIVIYALAFVMVIPMMLSGSELFARQSTGMEFVFLLLFLGLLMYFPIMESSKWQATLGKRAVGIKVTDTMGERISFVKALSRFFGKIVSAIILYIGFFMAGFTERKQALHDLIANTLVVRS